MLNAPNIFVRAYWWIWCESRQSKKKEDDTSYWLKKKWEIRNKMRLKVEKMEGHFIVSLPAESFRWRWNVHFIHSIYLYSQTNLKPFYSNAHVRDWRMYDVALQAYVWTWRTSVHPPSLKSTIKLKYYYQNHHTSFVFLLRKSVFCLFFSYNLLKLYSYLLFLAVL